LKPVTVSGEAALVMIGKNELRLVELIAARMSHDLVGPVGATVNGVELLTEDQTADADVVRLIGQSARQASRRLQVFRAIYGTAGTLPAGAPFAAAAQLLSGMLEGEKVAFGPWSVEPAIEAAAGRAGARIALLAAFLLVEALPRGGEVRLEARLSGNTARLDATAVGQGARLFEEVSATLAGKVPVDELSAKAAPAEMLRILAGAVGGRIGLAPGKDTIGISIAFPALGDD
jgi:histidine phosphotransferase ChpT